MSDISHHVALAVPVRARMFTHLQAAAEPLTARDLADEVGLHVTTVRFHLDVLQRAGLVGADPGPAAGRGRPAIRFHAIATSSGTLPSDGGDGIQAQMVEVLADALADRSSRDRPRTAGRRWAQRLPRPSGDPRTALVDGLAPLGFAPHMDGSSIRLHECPFGETARRHPDVVCRIHLGLAEGLVARAGGGSPRPVIDLEPFADPTGCVLTLADPDPAKPDRRRPASSNRKE